MVRLALSSKLLGSERDEGLWGCPPPEHLAHQRRHKINSYTSGACGSFRAGIYFSGRLATTIR